MFLAMRIMIKNTARFITMLTAALFCSHFVSAQNDEETTKFEIGLNIGTTFFLGDLGGNAGIGKNSLKDVNLELTKLMYGIYFEKPVNNWLNVRADLNRTFIEGADNQIRTNGIDELYRKQRNLDFRSRVWEAAIGAQIYPLAIADNIFNFYEYEPRLKPYLYAAVGVFNFKPQGSLTNASGTKTWYNLQPLRTEGQGMVEYPNSKPYKTTQIFIPLGAGLKYDVSEKLNLSFEMLYRRTFTDYLDDVSKTYIDPADFSKYLSATDANLARQLADKTIPIIFPAQTSAAIGSQRGDGNADTYLSAVFRLGLKIGNNNNRYAKQSRCPSFW
jgi:hypothetical protein